MQKCDVPFRGAARFGFIKKLSGERNGRTLFAPTAICGVIGVCAIIFSGYVSQYCVYVLCGNAKLYDVLKQCVKCVRISKKCAGKHKRAVEDASPYMVCKVHNKVWITQVQIKMRNENRSALVSYQIIFPPHITMSGDTITLSGSPLNRVRSASSPTFTEPTRSDMPAISAAVQVIASMPFS